MKFFFLVQSLLLQTKVYHFLNQVPCISINFNLKGNLLGHKIIGTLSKHTRRPGPEFFFTDILCNKLHK